MSFLSRLFGMGGEKAATSSSSAASDPENYKDCTIVAAPVDEGGQWRVGGTISRSVDGRTVKRRFIRADLCMSQEEAVAVSLRKARQIIDQNPRLFADPDDTSPV
ncbi:HlyU family transcriptional regulator [Pararhizobium haloflavum]|uniref:HlyU family transcriptional regulator n=1 Tax=Pararhizobium haloflavum TaxID=2037914 RepID=UPI000C17570E|nr:HlyU family transcriptional regulator [Pararhizobium haloflavum]